MTDIRKLITDIRAWEAADKSVHQIWMSDKPHYETKETYTAAIEQRNISARAVCHSEHNEWTLAVCVTLADHAEALQARIDDMEATEKNRVKWCEACHGYGYDVFDINLNSCVVCGGEGMVWGEPK